MGMKKSVVAVSLVATALIGVGIALAAVPQTLAPDKNIVQVAGASKDHTTLVAALKAANYITSLQNPGPFTVFAPTNAAFDKLPKGTLDNLLKPDQQEALRNILKYHVAVPTYKVADFKDGQVIGEANGGKVTMHVKDGTVKVNDATIVASIVASNGTIHVIDTVLLPPETK
jgi:uncharacterized surface protein with fasciclin (FAS1) repeats